MFAQHCFYSLRNGEVAIISLNANSDSDRQQLFLESKLRQFKNCLVILVVSEGVQKLDFISTLQGYSNVVVVSSDYGFNSFNFFRESVFQLNLQPFSPFLN